MELDKHDQISPMGGNRRAFPEEGPQPWAETHSFDPEPAGSYPQGHRPVLDGIPFAHNVWGMRPFPAAEALGTPKKKNEMLEERIIMLQVSRYYVI